MTDPGVNGIDNVNHLTKNVQHSHNLQSLSEEIKSVHAKRCYNNATDFVEEKWTHGLDTLLTSCKPRGGYFSEKCTHDRINKKCNLTPSGNKWNHRAMKIHRYLNFGPMHIWCEYEENRLKTLESRGYTRKTAFGPLVATNRTTGWQKCTGV